MTVTYYKVRSQSHRLLRKSGN